MLFDKLICITNDRLHVTPFQLNPLGNTTIVNPYPKIINAKIYKLPKIQLWQLQTLSFSLEIQSFAIAYHTFYIYSNSSKSKAAAFV